VGLVCPSYIHISSNKQHSLLSCLAADAEAKAQAAQANNSASSWWSKLEKWLCFYHALCSDEAKVAYAEKDKILPREKLDAGSNKHASSPKQWSQVVADKFNNADWIIETEAILGLHYDNYAESKKIGLANVDRPIIAEQVENRFTECQPALIKVKLH
jgi:hypothetical protein